MVVDSRGLEGYFASHLAPLLLGEDASWCWVRWPQLAVRPCWLWASALEFDWGAAHVRSTPWFQDGDLGRCASPAGFSHQGSCGGFGRLVALVFGWTGL